MQILLSIQQDHLQIPLKSPSFSCQLLYSNDSIELTLCQYSSNPVQPENRSDHAMLIPHPSCMYCNCRHPSQSPVVIHPSLCIRPPMSHQIKNRKRKSLRIVVSLHKTPKANCPCKRPRCHAPSKNKLDRRRKGCLVKNKVHHHRWQRSCRSENINRRCTTAPYCCRE